MKKNLGKDFLLNKLRSGDDLSRLEQFSLTLSLSVPAILAQLSMCLMSIIDAAMVGRLGATEAAAVGLVSSSTWILGGFCYANSSSFTVQIAHASGAANFNKARRIFSEGMLSVLVLSIFLGAAGAALSGILPVWLGGAPDVCRDGASYFLIYSLMLPFFQLAIFTEGSLIATGNIKVSSTVSILMCVLDVVFNYILIFLCGMGVRGAALGTGLSTLCAGVFMLLYIENRSKELKGEGIPIRTLKKETASQAINMAWPLWLQNIITRGAYIAATVLIAPLGTIAIAANSFAITAEGFCYLPGYGVQDAATSLIGQSLGAGRKKTARRFSWIAIGSGVTMMGALAILMYAFAPQIMSILTPDIEIISLGAKCLRIEAWAEIFFAASIVGYGCCVGAGDTLVPSVINLVCMWAVRIGLAFVLIPRYGLEGYWFAMASELTVKGIWFSIRIAGQRWMSTKLTRNPFQISA